MEDVEKERTCGESAKHEFNELCCKPKARCFKGLAILTGIYSLACGLMLMFIPPVINNHDDTFDDKVDHNLHKMVWSTGILLIIFAGLTIIFFLTFKVYERREGRRESIINGNLMADGDFTSFENDDDPKAGIPVSS